MKELEQEAIRLLLAYPGVDSKDVESGFYSDVIELMVELSKSDTVGKYWKDKL